MGFFKRVRRAFTPPRVIRKFQPVKALRPIQKIAKKIAPIFPPAAILTAKPLQTFVGSMATAARLSPLGQKLEPLISAGESLFSKGKEVYESVEPYARPMLETMAIAGGAVPGRLAAQAVEQELEEFLPEEEEGDVGLDELDEDLDFFDEEEEEDY